MKKHEDDRNPENYLRDFRLPDATPALKAKVLGAARQAWSEPAARPRGIATLLQEPLWRVAGGLAASILFLISAHQINDRLLCPPARPLASLATQETNRESDSMIEDIGISQPAWLLKPHISYQSHSDNGGSVSERAAMMLELLHEAGSDGNRREPKKRRLPETSRWDRQIMSIQAS